MWHAEAREGFLVQLLSLPEIIMEALVTERFFFVAISNKRVLSVRRKHGMTWQVVIFNWTGNPDSEE